MMLFMTSIVIVRQVRLVSAVWTDQQNNIMLFSESLSHPSPQSLYCRQRVSKVRSLTYLLIKYLSSLGTTGHGSPLDWNMINLCSPALYGLQVAMCRRYSLLGQIYMMSHHLTTFFSSCFLFELSVSFFIGCLY